MKKLTLIFFLLLALSTASCAPANNPAIQASGLIEATQVTIAPEQSGRVVEVSVSEGDSVKAGDPLLRLDDSLLLSEQQAAQAALDSARAGVQTAQNALDTAKAQYQSTLESQLSQDQASRLHDWFVKDPKQFDQPGWYFSRAEQIQAAQDQVDIAQKAVQDAQANLDKISQSAAKSDFSKAEERLLNARLAYLITKNVNTQAQNSTSSKQPVGAYNSTHCGSNQGYSIPRQYLVNVIYDCNGDPQLSSAGRALQDNAQNELNNAQKAYNDLLSSQAADEILKARAEVQVDQEYYYAALDFLRTLQTGDQSPEVSAAQGAVDQAKDQLEQAQSAVTSAQANLNLINTQIQKLTIHAPMDGVVLVRSVEVGEVIQAGLPALTIGKLDTLKVTVYIPENQYGQISLGQQARLSVDSFPNETFAAKVTRISDKAEFTPQNVQTKEGRQTTVYAVELSVDNPSGKLKPGMPTDVTFVKSTLGK
jgi:multidrug resistance efflux pump